jgi:hypothetical protein
MEGRLFIPEEIVVQKAQAGDDPRGHSCPEESFFLVLIQGGQVIIQDHIIDFFALQEGEKPDGVRVNPGIDSLPVRGELPVETDELGSAHGLVNGFFIGGKKGRIDFFNFPTIRNLGFSRLLEVGRLIAAAKGGEQEGRQDRICPKGFEGPEWIHTTCRSEKIQAGEPARKTGEMGKESALCLPPPSGLYG